MQRSVKSLIAILIFILRKICTRHMAGRKTTHKDWQELPGKRPFDACHLHRCTHISHVDVDGSFALCEHQH